MSNFQPDEAAKARMLAEQQDALTSHLTQAAAQVYDTHAGRPEDEVMQELLRRAKAPGYEPNTEGLQPGRGDQQRPDVRLRERPRRVAGPRE